MIYPEITVNNTIRYGEETQAKPTMAKKLKQNQL